MNGNDCRQCGSQNHPGANNPVVTSLYIAGEDGTGEVQAVEMVPQIPGQTSLDGGEQEAPAALKIIKFA